jgi:hypothetical protein
VDELLKEKEMRKEPTVKQEIRKACKNRCFYCGMTKREHIRRFGRNHRLVAKSRYSLEGCKLFCRPCHQLRIHGIGGESSTISGLVLNDTKREFTVLCKRLGFGQSGMVRVMLESFLSLPKSGIGSAIARYSKRRGVLAHR